MDNSILFHNLANTYTRIACELMEQGDVEAAREAHASAVLLRRRAARKALVEKVGTEQLAADVERFIMQGRKA
jgi:hypothetical protein